MQRNNLTAFIDEIIDSKELPGLSPEVRLQVHSDLMSQLTDQINRALIEALPDKEIAELNTLLDAADISDENIAQFMQSSGVDTQRVAVQTMLRFRDLYLEPR